MIKALCYGCRLTVKDMVSEVIRYVGSSYSNAHAITSVKTHILNSIYMLSWRTVILYLCKVGMCGVIRENSVSSLNMPASVSICA